MVVHGQNKNMQCVCVCMHMFVHNFSLSQHCLWRVLSPGIWHNLVHWKSTDVSEVILPWRWRRYVPPKRSFKRLTFSRLHGIISKKTMPFVIIRITFSSNAPFWNVTNGWRNRYVLGFWEIIVANNSAVIMFPLLTWHDVLNNTSSVIFYFQCPKAIKKKDNFLICLYWKCLWDFSMMWSLRVTDIV
jgi:hypothetical protein